MASAVVLGASGLVGRHILREILDSGAYGEVRAVGRRAPGLAHRSLREITTDLSRLGDHPGLFRADAVFCALGTTIRKAGSQQAFRRVDLEYPLEAGRLAAGQNAGKFLVVSAVGADSASRVFYNRVKGELEDRLRELPLRGLHIFRPSLLLGEREEFRLGESLAAPLLKALGGVLPARYRAIEASVVARAMVTVALGRAAPGAGVYESEHIARIGRARGYDEVVINQRRQR